MKYSLIILAVIFFPLTLCYFVFKNRIKEEEDKMNSINFVWDVSKLGFRTTEDKWSDTYVELENYYSKKNNYKTVPSQKTYIGHWLSDQMSFKTRQDRENRTDLLRIEKEKMLGKLLYENGVEWEYKKQKHRESIEEGLKKGYGFM